MPAQIVGVPVIADGIAGTLLMVTVLVAVEVQPLPPVAITVIVPPVALAVALILFVGVAPVHPEGSVQL